MRARVSLQKGVREVVISDMLAALYEAREFIDDHVDVLDGDDGQPRPNRAMSLLPEIDAAIAAAKAAGIKAHSKSLADELEDQVCIAIAEKIAMRDALLRLANAADDVGVKYFDTDTMQPEVEELQAATQAARAAARAAGIKAQS